MRDYSILWQQMRCLTEIKTLMATGVLDPDQLRQVARELDVLEDDLPHFGEGIRIAAMEDSFRAIRVQSLEGLFKEWEIHDKPVPRWRQGSFGKLTLLNWCEINQSSSKRMAEGDGRTWAEARVATREACAEIVASRDYVMGLVNRPLAKLDYIPIQKIFRDGLAQLRLLRAAALYRADGTLPDADDPFGGKLCWSKKGHVFRIWSRGVDGIDDGGSGGWNPKHGRDIVLAVRR